MAVHLEKLYNELKYKGRRQHIPEIMDILNRCRELGQINQDQYGKVCMEIFTANTKEHDNHHSNNNVADPNKSLKTMALMDKFLILCQDTKENGIDHTAELNKLAEALKGRVINNADYRKMYNIMTI